MNFSAIDFNLSFGIGIMDGDIHVFSPSFTSHGQCGVI